MKKIIVANIMLGLIGSSFLFNSCTKEEKDMPLQDQNSHPFFFVEKGDSVSKEIYRDKPVFESDFKVLYSTENDFHLKSLTSDYTTHKYITGLYISVNADGPGWYGYTKIDCDLNKGAGGKYIYLWYTRAMNEDYHIGVYKGPFGPVHKTCLSNIAISSQRKGYEQYYGYEMVDCSNNKPFPGADLNEGAGGNYIYLFEKRYNESSFEPWKMLADIAIVSASSSNFLVPQGWEKIDSDLNKGAGGSYIYILIKRGSALDFM